MGYVSLIVSFVTLFYLFRLNKDFISFKKRLLIPPTESVKTDFNSVVAEVAESDGEKK